MAESCSLLYVGLNASEKDFLAHHFARSEHKTISVDDFAAARERINSQKIDLIFLQASADKAVVQKLAGITGRYPSLPVVLICDRADEGIVLDAWHAGAADILFSPIASQSLDACLQRLSKKYLAGNAAEGPPPAAHFFYLDETGKECRVDIDSPRFTIGRRTDNNLVLHQMGVSRRHAEISHQNGQCFIRDLDSTHGTFVNGVRVQDAQLSSGDQIQLGGPQGVGLTFHTGDLLQSLLSISDLRIDVDLSLHRYKDFGKLFAAFRALGSVPVLDNLLALVVDTAIELSGAERGFIMLKEHSGNLSFRCARSRNRRPLDGSCFKTSRSVPEDVFASGRPVVIKDLDAENHGETIQLGVRSISCVPLRYLAVRDSSDPLTSGCAETIGVLYVDSACAGQELSNTRIDALETLASEAAMAIYNARLYKDSQDKRRMDEQLAIAREIQQALLPPPSKHLEYARACSQSLPCYDIGGDYFDYFDLEQGRFGFAIGDVAGKGMPAALLASHLQGIFSAQTHFEDPLPSIISNVNRRLAQRGAGNRFVTFFFGIIDADGRCTYVNAGHNPPFLLSPDGSMKELTTGGVVLGLFAGAHYQAETIQLQPNDHLILFTDGVIEALNDRGEEFGLDRLASLLRTNARAETPEILDRLQRAVLSFSSNAPQYDDITMMVVGYRESR